MIGDKAVTPQLVGAQLLLKRKMSREGYRSSLRNEKDVRFPFRYVLKQVRPWRGKRTNSSNKLSTYLLSRGPPDLESKPNP